MKGKAAVNLHKADLVDGCWSMTEVAGLLDRVAVEAVECGCMGKAGDGTAVRTCEADAVQRGSEAGGGTRLDEAGEGDWSSGATESWDKTDAEK